MEICEKMANESNVAYESFCQYYSMENRDLRELAKNSNRSLKQINQWAEKFIWQERLSLISQETAHQIDKKDPNNTITNDVNNNPDDISEKLSAIKARLPLQALRAVEGMQNYFDKICGKFEQQDSEIASLKFDENYKQFNSFAKILSELFNAVNSVEPFLTNSERSKHDRAFVQYVRRHPAALKLVSELLSMMSDFESKHEIE